MHEKKLFSLKSNILLFLDTETIHLQFKYLKKHKFLEALHLFKEKESRKEKAENA